MDSRYKEVIREQESALEDFRMRNGELWRELQRVDPNNSYLHKPISRKSSPNRSGVPTRSKLIADILKQLQGWHDKKIPEEKMCDELYELMKDWNDIYDPYPSTTLEMQHEDKE